MKLDRNVAVVIALSLLVVLSLGGLVIADQQSSTEDFTGEFDPYDSEDVTILNDQLALEGSYEEITDSPITEDESFIAVDYSPNGDYVAVMELGEGINIYGTDTWGVEETLNPDVSSHALAFSPDGDYLAFGAGDADEVYIYETDGWTEVTTLDQADGEPEDVRWSADGEYVAYTDGFEGNVHVHNVDDWSHEETLSEDAGNMLTVAISPDSDYLAFGGTSGDLYVYDTGSWTLVHSFDDGNAVNDLDFSSDGQYLAHADGDDNAYIHDTDDWSVSQTLSEPTNGVDTIRFSNNDAYLAAGTSDDIYVYQTREWEFQETLSFGTSWPGDLSISPDRDIAYVDGDNLRIEALDFPESGYFIQEYVTGFTEEAALSWIDSGDVSRYVAFGEPEDWTEWEDGESGDWKDLENDDDLYVKLELHYGDASVDEYTIEWEGEYSFLTDEAQDGWDKTSIESGEMVDDEGYQLERLVDSHGTEDVLTRTSSSSRLDVGTSEIEDPLRYDQWETKTLDETIEPSDDNWARSGATYFDGDWYYLESRSGSQRSDAVYRWDDPGSTKVSDLSTFWDGWGVVTGGLADISDAGFETDDGDPAHLITGDVSGSNTVEDDFMVVNVDTGDTGIISDSDYRFQTVGIANSPECDSCLYILDEDDGEYSGLNLVHIEIESTSSIDVKSVVDLPSWASDDDFRGLGYEESTDTFYTYVNVVGAIETFDSNGNMGDGAGIGSTTGAVGGVEKSEGELLFLDIEEEEAKLISTEYTTYSDSATWQSEWFDLERDNVALTNGYIEFEADLRSDQSYEVTLQERGVGESWSTIDTLEVSGDDTDSTLFNFDIEGNDEIQFRIIFDPDGKTFVESDGGMPTVTDVSFDFEYYDESGLVVSHDANDSNQGIDTGDVFEYRDFTVAGESVPGSQIDVEFVNSVGSTVCELDDVIGQTFEFGEDCTIDETDPDNQRIFIEYHYQSDGLETDSLESWELVYEPRGDPPEITDWSALIADDSTDEFEVTSQVDWEDEYTIEEVNQDVETVTWYLNGEQVQQENVNDAGPFNYTKTWSIDETGEHTVTGEVFSEADGTDSITWDVTVDEPPPPEFEAWSATIGGQDTTELDYSTGVGFEDTFVVEELDQEVNEVRWYIDDDLVHEEDVSGDGPFEFTHEWDEDGSYEVTAEVEADYGITNTLTWNINVHDIGIIGPSSYNVDPGEVIDIQQTFEIAGDSEAEIVVTIEYDDEVVNRISGTTNATVLSGVSRSWEFLTFEEDFDGTPITIHAESGDMSATKEIHIATTSDAGAGFGGFGSEELVDWFSNRWIDEVPVMDRLAVMNQIYAQLGLGALLAGFLWLEYLDRSGRLPGIVRDQLNWFGHLEMVGLSAALITLVGGMNPVPHWMLLAGLVAGIIGVQRRFGIPWLIRRLLDGVRSVVRSIVSRVRDR